MSTTKNPKLRTKDYEICFEVSKRTAQRMISADKKKRKTPCFTALDFYIMYGFQIVPLCAIFCQKTPYQTMQ